ncbi:MAG: histidine kinase [Lachnospiraceae bacterium]|nr:histidine kinase [Lachnospiraceae bacterium]MBP3735447.1 histidine kinase [Lachnospiraceae bacterium]
MTISNSIALLYIFGAMILLLMAAGCIQGMERYERRTYVLTVLLLLGAALMLTGLSIALLVNPAMMLRRQILQMVLRVLYFTTLAVFTAYLMLLMQGDDIKLRWRVNRPIIAICLLGAICWAAETLYTESGLGFVLFLLGQIAIILATLFDMAIVWKYRERLGPLQVKSSLVYLILPFMALLFVGTPYFEKVLHMLLAFRLAYLYVTLHVHRNLRYQQERAANAQLQLTLLESRLHPHFIYNVLNIIYYLCEQDPATAQKAVSDFSTYLRANLSAADERALPIPFAEEWNATEKYLALEKLRYEDDLRVETDFKVMNFLVQPFLLRSLVNNAVRHGIAKKEDGGTVRITADIENDNYVITVSDDGVGFDTSLLKDTGDSHFGLRSIGEQLRQIGGSMEVTSSPGAGTTVRVNIPTARA